ncbi:MAG: iron ABC transporter permease [Planctomycetes bacterium]|nr:iron ABC transporter permease [Planctomycetota bacterium]
MALLILVIWLAPRIGAVEHDAASEREVISTLRMPRLQMGMAAGAGLALAGMIFQAIFRNPLATPFTLGVSTGASLALAIGLALGLEAGKYFGLEPGEYFGLGRTAVAFVGALMVVAVVYAVAQVRSESSTSTLLLAGVSLNFICGAGIILVQFFLREHELKAMILWLIGSVEVVGQEEYDILGFAFQYNPQALTVSLVLLGGLVMLVLIHRDLDLLMMGEQMAAGRGVNVRRSRALAYFCASLITAAVVSVCGPIAFVGLLVPHTMRAVVGPTHRLLLPACVLFGASLLPICDCIARNFLAWTTENNYSELPVGVVTNVLGGIFFLVVLIRQRSDRPILA